MLEPPRAPLRLIDMKRSVILFCLAAALTLSACGSAPATKGESSDRAGAATPSSGVGDCPDGSPAISEARSLARVDLDGDGTPDEVKLTALGGDCPNTIFAQVGEGYLSGQLPADGPPVRSAMAVTLAGGKPALLATRQEHPRGGYQIRLFASTDSGLTEVTLEDHALIPFVATDVQEHPLSVDCANGGLTVTEAVAHQPVGVIFAWDIRRTPYAVDGGAVTKGSTEEIADNVLPDQLEKQYPQLVEHTMFQSCG